MGRVKAAAVSQASLTRPVSDFFHLNPEPVNSGWPSRDSSSHYHREATQIRESDWVAAITIANRDSGGNVGITGANPIEGSPR